MNEINWVLLSLSVVVIGCALYGWHKGLIRILMVMCSTVVAIVVSIWLAPPVTEWVCAHTDWDERLEQKCEEAIDSWLEKEAPLDETEDLEEENLLLTLTNKLEASYGITIPKTFLAELTGQEENASAAQRLSQGLAKAAAGQILSIACYFGVMLAILVILRIILAVLNAVAKLPVVHVLNKTAGLLVGFAQGMLIVWVLLAVISLMQQTEFGIACMEQIRRSELLSFLVKYNFMNWVVGRL